MEDEETEGKLSGREKDKGDRGEEAVAMEWDKWQELVSVRGWLPPELLLSISYNSRSSGTTLATADIRHWQRGKNKKGRDEGG